MTRRWRVAFTPGPPAIGVLTTEVVEADTAAEAEAQIKGKYPIWCMVHRIEFLAMGQQEERER